MHVLIAALHRPTMPTGVCRHAANLARCLADTNEVTQVTIVIGAWQKSYFPTAFPLTSEKVRWIEIGIQNRSISRNLWFLTGLPQLVHTLKPDLVHLAFPLPFQRSTFPCPVFATIHDLYAYDLPENFGRVRATFNRWFLKQCVNQSDGLACVSQETLKRLEFYFPKVSKDRTAVIYNYVEFETGNAVKPELLRMSEDSSFLMCVAQHRKNKNLDLLIEAFALLLNTGKLAKTTRLIVVGNTGPETATLEAKIKQLNLDENLCLVASIPDAELCWLYQHCQAFVIPSSSEGFCIPLVEALTFSCRVVCSDIPIFREIGSSYCRYFPLTEHPVQNLADTIVETIHHPPISASYWKDPRFSKATVAQQYLDFYRMY